MGHVTYQVKFIAFEIVDITDKSTFISELIQEKTSQLNAQFIFCNTNETGERKNKL